jgi:carboxylesterase
LIGAGLLLCGVGLLLLRGEGRAALARDLERARPSGRLPGAAGLELGAPTAPAAALLLHGWATCPADFAELPERLAACGLFVRAPLLAGHGVDPQAFARVSLAEIEAQVRAEYEALAGRFERVFLVGFSMGAALCLTLEAELPAERLPAGLALVAPFFEIQRPAWLPIDPARAARWLEPWLPYLDAGPEFVRLADKRQAQRVVKFEALPLSAVGLLADLRTKVAAPGRLEACRSPLAMVLSSGDRAADPRAAERAFERLGSPDKRLLVVDRSDHQLLLDFDAEAILSFLEARLCPPR